MVGRGIASRERNHHADGFLGRVARTATMPGGRVGAAIVKPLGRASGPRIVCIKGEAAMTAMLLPTVGADSTVEDITTALADLCHDAKRMTCVDERWPRVHAAINELLTGLEERQS